MLRILSAFLKWMALALAGCVILFLLFRNYFLHTALERMQDKLRDKTGFVFSFGDAAFSGLLTVVLQEVALSNTGGDVILQLSNIKITPSLFSFMVLNANISRIELSGGIIRLRCQQGDFNFRFHERNDSKLDEKAPGLSESNFSRMAHKLYDKLFDLSPQFATVKNLRIEYADDSTDAKIFIPNYASNSDSLSGKVIDELSGTEWQIAGTFNKPGRSGKLLIQPTHNGQTIPYLEKKYHLTMGFGSAEYSFSQADYKHGVFGIPGRFKLHDFFIYQRRISSDTVVVNRLEGDLKVSIGKNYFRVDQGSSFLLNELMIASEFYYRHAAPKEISIRLATDTVQGNSFFASLPDGLFSLARSVKSKGQVRFHLDFACNLEMPDSLRFTVQLQRFNLHITDHSKANLDKLNTDFVHAVYEQDRLVRSFVVGPANPSFTPYDSISPYLVNAIQTAEDGDFFYHNGFSEEAFRKSIAENIKAGRFVRGGSTISMQLVKNVFLSRNKTISRKAEEALLVWLIETNRITSKKRMLEVYLNIIEFGPNVYGIHEAAGFYFSKLPSQLTLAESVFLSSLLPRPKAFRYSFDADGNLKPYLADYYRVVGNFLLKRGLITEAEAAALEAKVQLTGEARKRIAPADTLPVPGEFEMSEDE